MLILGIDPGTRNCGYALIEKEGIKIRLIEAGMIKMKPEDLQFQIPQMVEGFDQIFKTHKIDEVAMESMFYAHNPKTVIKLAQFRGAIMLKILQEFGNFAEYTPLQIKKAVTGKAKASKEQVAFMVQRLLGIKKEIRPLDISDAMAVAITHGQRV
ncbi:MAG: crossover junction endodeoxyribonuclease RuvC [Campylobacterota bacterium]|nr:crossover junction endodeoxyribonuclease RuvC [Campylobacterota bacterium]